MSVVDPPRKTRMTETRSREHSAAQSTWLPDVNFPERTFARWMAPCGWGTVHPRLASSARIALGTSVKAAGFNRVVAISAAVQSWPVTVTNPLNDRNSQDSPMNRTSSFPRWSPPTVLISSVDATTPVVFETAWSVWCPTGAPGEIPARVRRTTERQLASPIIAMRGVATFIPMSLSRIDRSYAPRSPGAST